MSTFVERLLGGKAGTVVTVEPDWIVINDGVSHAVKHYYNQFLCSLDGIG